MSAARPTGWRTRAPRLLFAAAVLALPVTGLDGPDQLGELKGSASVFILIPTALAFGLSVRVSAIEIPRSVLVFFATLIAWIAIDTALNYELIGTAALQDRSGGGKLATASMVIVLGVMVCVMALHLLREASDLRALFLRPLALGVLACAAFAVPELITWVTPAGTGLYRWTTALFHTAVTEEGRGVGRLVSLAFEAADLSYFSGLTLPWLVLGARLAAQDPLRRGRAVAYGALASGLALVLFSNSRTGFLMVAALVGAEAAFWLGLRVLRLPAALCAAVVAACLLGYGIFIALNLPAIGMAAVAGEDVSTVTRSALLTAQLAVFAEHPWLGVGFGQNGFYLSEVMPPWAWGSYEIERFFETAGELPPTFNVLGRLGSELGVPGLLIWFGFWTATVHRIAAAAPGLPDRSFALHVNLAVLSSTACFLVGGISTDPFRRPETWILVALAGLYAGPGRGAERPGPALPPAATWSPVP